MMVRFIYGAGFVQVNVTEKATQAFVQENKLSIPRNVSFNDVLGDVIPNHKKTLLIELEDGSLFALPEHRTVDFSINLQ